MLQATVLRLSPLRGLVQTFELWRSGLWRVAMLLGLTLVLGACGGGGGGGGGVVEPPPVPPPTGAPAITAQPANVAITAGQTASFSVTASGTGPLTYEWLRNGVAIAGSNAATYTLAATTLADNGAAFSVNISNAGGRVTSSTATLAVSAAVIPPIITTQPAAGVSAVAGSTARLAVVATGTEPSYQWFKDSAAIAGATAAEYQTPALALADSGAVYFVRITNSAGSVESTRSTLTVTPVPVPPTISTQPVDVSVTAGQNASFTVVASGDTPLAYQWRRNGTAIDGGTGASYTTPVTTLADNDAVYSVVVTNSAGTITSAGARLTVLAAVTAPSIVTPPASVTVGVGGVATFTVVAQGTGPLTYQWRRGSQVLAGATSASYTTPVLQAIDNGSLYSVRVSNAAGSVDSANVSVTVSAAVGPPVIVRQPLPAVVSLGSGAFFAVSVSGALPMNYQWRKNGVNIAGATGATYLTPATVAGDNGAQFSVVASNSLGTVTSANALLSISTGGSGGGSGGGTPQPPPTPVAPTLLTQPASQAVFAGQSAGFNVGVSGSLPITYQWRRNGVIIAGSNANSYNTPLTTLADNGAVFDVVVTNSVGSVTSSPATLTVLATTAFNYWLRGESGQALAGTIAFANGPQTTSRFNLTLVDPANPAAPQFVETRGTWLLQAAAEEPRFNPQNPGDATERLVVYARGTRLWRLDLLAAGGSPRPVPTPVQVSSASLTSLCAPSAGETFAPLFFPDRANAGNSVLQYRVPGVDGLCRTADDGFVAVRANTAPTVAPVPVPRIIASFNSQSGSLSGFLARSGNTLQRLDSNLGNATTAFTVGSGEIELLRYPSGPGTIVFRDGNLVRAFDPAVGGAPVTVATAAPDFLQLGEVGSPTPTALYLNGGRIIAYKLDNSGPSSTLLTLTGDQTLTRGGAIPGQLMLVLASGGSSRLIGFDASGALTPLFDEPGLIDSTSVGATPTRWVYTVNNHTELRSVPRAGGAPVTLAQSSNLSVLNIGSWNHETIWYDLTGQGGTLLPAEVRAINSDGTNPLLLASAVTVGGAVFNGFSDTSVGRIVAQPISAAAGAPYSGISIAAFDMGTRATRVTYGAVGLSGYNVLDVSRLSGPDRPVLVTAARAEGLARTSSDLYLLRVGAPGLVRVTNFVP